MKKILFSAAAMSALVVLALTSIPVYSGVKPPPPPSTTTPIETARKDAQKEAEVLKEEAEHRIEVARKDAQQLAVAAQLAIQHAEEIQRLFAQLTMEDRKKVQQQVDKAWKEAQQLS